MPNDQDAQVVDGEFDQWMQQFRAKWQSAQCLLRPPAILRYNCHGLTFASRRTWIDDASLIPEILSADGFEEIAATDALPGDVIVYFDQNGRAEHSGLVVANERRGELQIPMPRILSKWAKAYEVVHWANQCPYETRFVKYYRIKLGRTKQ